MEEVLKSLPMHGYVLLAFLCLLEAVGFPLPAALAILTAGALSAYGQLNPFLAFGAAFAGIMLGDVILFLLGALADGHCSDCSAGCP